MRLPQNGVVPPGMSQPPRYFNINDSFGAAGLGVVVSLLCYAGWLSSSSLFGKFLVSQLYSVSVGYTKLFLSLIDKILMPLKVTPLAPAAATLMPWIVGIGLSTLALYTFVPPLINSYFKRYPRVSSSDQAFSLITTSIGLPSLAFAAALWFGVSVGTSLWVAWGLTTVVGSYWGYQKRKRDYVVPEPQPAPKISASTQEKGVRPSAQAPAFTPGYRSQKKATQNLRRESSSDEELSESASEDLPPRKSKKRH